MVPEFNLIGGAFEMAKAPTAAVVTGYCMKCKTQRPITSAKPVTMKNGRPATEGTCPECGTKMFKIGAAK
jgi:RNase P subunit RPR2